jgi:hypothetical protein
MGGVCEDRFEGLEYHQGVSIRYERVEVSNSCARTLIFGSFSFIVFFVNFFSFYSPIFVFLLSFLLPFSFFRFGFLSSFVPPPLLFSALFYLFFSSCGFICSLPNLFGTKRVVVVVELSSMVSDPILQDIEKQCNSLFNCQGSDVLVPPTLSL